MLLTTDQQIRDKLLPLKKWDWAFDQMLHHGGWSGFNMGELEELNNHYYDIFGTYNSITCCVDTWIPHIAKWYWEHKTRLNYE